MTNEQAQKLRGQHITMVEALKLAFDAGEAYQRGSGKPFKQVHLNQAQVLSILTPRIIQ